MYRSWAYILMVVATLAGVVGLLWPSPSVRTIEEIAMPARSAPARAEAPAKAAKAAGKPAQGAKPAARAEAAPAPPAVVKRMPPQTTSTKRAGAAVPQNGMQPNMLGNPPGEGMLGRGGPAAAAPPARPGGAITPRPLNPPRPSTEQPSRDPAAR